MDSSVVDAVTTNMSLDTPVEEGFVVWTRVEVIE
jgi:hypothetical protein